MGFIVFKWKVGLGSLLRMRFNRKFYQSADFIFGIYLMVIQLIVLSNHKLVISDLGPGAGQITWWIIAGLFLIISLFDNQKNPSDSQRQISDRGYLMFLVSIVLLDSLVFFLTLEQFINVDLGWRLFLVVNFIGWFFNSGFSHQFLSRSSSVSQKWKVVNLIVLIFMFALPAVLFGVILK